MSAVEFLAGLGLSVAALVSRWIEGLLYGVAPTDATTYALTAGLMLAVALATAAGPALRAACTDPLLAIRTD